MQDKIDLKDDNYHLVSNGRFKEYLEKYNTMRCAGGKPTKELDTSSILPPYSMKNRLPPAEIFIRRQGRRSRKYCK